MRQYSSGWLEISAEGNKIYHRVVERGLVLRMTTACRFGRQRSPGYGMPSSAIASSIDSETARQATQLESIGTLLGRPVA